MSALSEFVLALAALVSAVALLLLVWRKIRPAPAASAFQPEAHYIDELLLPEAPYLDEPQPETRPEVAATLEEALVAYFNQTRASRLVLARIVNDGPVSMEELISTVAGVPARDKGPPLPDHVVRSIVMMLMAADLVDNVQGWYTASPFGRELVTALDAG